MKGSSRYEDLTNCAKFKAGDTLLIAAKIREDNRLIISLEGQDYIAIEVRYHRTCYQRYTHIKELDNLLERCEEIASEEGSHYDITFKAVVRKVQEEAIDGLEILKMTDLCTFYVGQLKELGLNISGYRSEKLKNRLIKHFDDTIYFWHPRYRSESEVVFSNEVPEGQIVEAGLLSTEEKEYNISFKDLHSNHDLERNVFQCTKLLRSYIKETTLEGMKFPPSQEDINEEAAPLPDMLYNFPGWLLSQSDECKELNKGKITTLSARMHHKVVSIAQDIVFIASNGSKLTPKHIAFPMTMKSIIGSAEVLTLLNRFGHGVSYSKLEEIETAMAERQINKHENKDLLPSNCQKNIFQPLPMTVMIC